jgi:hypothetical protein
LSFKLSVVFCAHVADLLTLVIIRVIPPIEERPEPFFIIKNVTSSKLLHTSLEILS